MKLPRLNIFQIIAAIAFVIIALRMFLPKLIFDSTSLILFGIAATVLLLPRLLLLLPPLKKLKIWEVEAEFNEAINKFEKSVGEAEQSPIKHSQVPEGVYPPMHGEYVSGFKDILSSRTSTTEKIVAAGILCEQMLTQTARDLDLNKEGRLRTPRAIVQELAKNGFINDAEQQAFNEFWDIRNSVIHGKISSPNEEQTARLLDLLWRLVRTLA